VKVQSFALLTTSRSGIEFAVGLSRAGHELRGIGVGVSEHAAPIGSLEVGEIRASFSPAVSVEEIDLGEAESTTEFLSRRNVDFVALAWPKMLDRATLEKADWKIIGTHPTPLPRGRGRHPLHWMKVLGIKQTRVTAFWLNSDVDAGRVIAWVPFRVSGTSPIANDATRLARAYKSLGWVVGVALRFSSAKGSPQSHSKGTYWRKRSETDCQLTFRMNPKSIVWHVRSFSSPWPGATIKGTDGLTYSVTSAQYAPFAMLKSKNRWSTFGTVLAERKPDGQKSELIGSKVLVRCFNGAVWMTLRDRVPPESTFL
jgi:methionyl-tRNA formyltransferase